MVNRAGRNPVSPYSTSAWRAAIAHTAGPLRVPGAHMLRENRVGNRRSSSLRSKNPMVATDMYYRPGRDI